MHSLAGNWANIVKFLLKWRLFQNRLIHAHKQMPPITIWRNTRLYRARNCLIHLCGCSCKPDDMQCNYTCICSIFQPSHCKHCHTDWHVPSRAPVGWRSISWRPCTARAPPVHCTAAIPLSRSPRYTDGNIGIQAQIYYSSFLSCNVMHFYFLFFSRKKLV